MIYSDNKDYRAMRRAAIEEMRVGVGHEHSSLIEDCDKFKVVVCYKHVHTTVTFETCCVVNAEKCAERYFQNQFGIIVDVAEIWDRYDIEHGEPGETFYPDNHVDCTKSVVSKND